MNTELHRGALEAGDDHVQPFLLEVSGIRGRLLRLGPLVQAILARHAYPEPVARLLGEMLALTGAMASLMKFEGVFTVQIKGDGPVGLMVADVTDAGDLRGYAAFDKDRLDALEGANPPAFEALVGKGYFAFTLDRGAEHDRYQGIVELRGEGLADCLQHYFLQSDQVQSGIVLAADRVAGQWRAGALILQRVPDEGGQPFPGGGDPEEEEAWRRAMILQVTCSDKELLDPALPNNDLLYRLFHEEGVRVFTARPLTGACRCSRKKLEGVLKVMEPADLEALKVEGRIAATCEFCSRAYEFDAADLARINADP